jgi:hypothetical protein
VFRRRDRNRRVQIGEGLAQNRDPTLRLVALDADFFPALSQNRNGMVGHAGKPGNPPSVFFWRLRHNTGYSLFAAMPPAGRFEQR